jgi:murein tripeptide amidase MpaA
VVYFSYGVHGNESSSSEAAMWTAWDLARDAAEVRGVLDSLVVIIDPVANPDGRDRYVNWFRSVAAHGPTSTRRRASTASRGRGAASTTTSST